MKRAFTITIITEQSIGILVRIAALFSRRRIEIERLSVKSGDPKDTRHFTICITETEEVTKNLVLQIDKQVDVLQTFCHTDEAIVG